MNATTDGQQRSATGLAVRLGVAVLGCSFLALGGTSGSQTAFIPASAAVAQSSPGQLPAPPANGIMGFVVYHFVPSVLQGKDACPDGFTIRTRERFLANLPPDEAERLRRKENDAEFMRRYMADVTRPDGSNICTQSTLFPDRPTVRTVQSKFAWGLNLDGDEGEGATDPDGCAHENFVAPDGQKGIDNQAYRALGCKVDWRGEDGIAGDIVRGYDGFLASGEWSQVLLLRGVDSLVNDDNVEVIYANTPDRPVADSTGKFIRNASFTISDKAPRARNVLRGRIVNGVLTTEPTLIRLSQTWGQAAQRETRGLRNQWTLHKARLRLSFQPDGSLKGIVGGYEPIEEFVVSTSLGGIGNLVNGGSDCAGEYNTLRKLADGMRDPKTGRCTAASTGLELAAVPAFVNDVASQSKVASR